MIKQFTRLSDRTAEGPKQYFNQNRTVTKGREYTLYRASIEKTQIDEILNIIVNVNSNAIGKKSGIYYEIKEDNDNTTLSAMENM